MARAVLLLLYETILVRLAIEDFQTRKIRNRYPVLILLLSVAAVVLIYEITWKERIWGMFAVSVPMILLNFLVPGSFGGGDVKLCFACGAFLGGERILNGTILALFLAGIYSLWLILTGKWRKNVRFAFGPFLAAGFLVMSAGLWNF